jgi:hypothetical protein
MGKIVISSRILTEPVQMMGVLLREVESLATEAGIDPDPIKQEILSAETVESIEAVLEKYLPNEIIIDF